MGDFEKIEPNLDDITSVFAFSDDPPEGEPPQPPEGAPPLETPPPAPAPTPAPAPAPAQTPAPTPTPEPESGGTPPAPAPLPGLEAGGVSPPAQIENKFAGVTEKDLELANLKAQIAALQAQISQPPPQAESETPEQALAKLVKPEEYSYNLSIPQQVLEAVFSEDAGQAATGMHHLINNLASIIHRNVLAASRKDLQSYRSEVTSTSSDAEFAKARDNAQAEYYKDFPHHNEPLIKMIVAQEAQKLGAEYPQLPWGDQFKLALGARVDSALATLRGQQQQPPPAPTPTPTSRNTPVNPKPASFLPVTPSVGIPQFENDAEVIASTFSFGS